MKLSPSMRAAIAAFPKDRVTRLAPAAAPGAPRPAAPARSYEVLDSIAFQPDTRLGFVQPSRRMGVWDALQWAFADQAAQIELPSDVVRGHGYASAGTECRLLEAKQLGCTPDGGGAKLDRVHEDAEALAAALRTLPDRKGGLRMALRVAETARSGVVPDWMPGAVPRCVPQTWRRANQHGVRLGKAEKVGEVVVVEMRRAGRSVRAVRKVVDVMATPVTWEPSPQRIQAARREYRKWWHALLHVQRTVLMAGGLRRHELTADMPAGAPWHVRKVGC